MEKLRIKNFGAITEGLKENSGYIELSKMTLFLGEQGSGKSTITKLFSTFLWLQLMRVIYVKQSEAKESRILICCLTKILR